MHFGFFITFELSKTDIDKHISLYPLKLGGGVNTNRLK